VERMKVYALKFKPQYQKKKVNGRDAQIDINENTGHWKQITKILLDKNRNRHLMPSN
jgi:hypothetical protein